MIEITKSPTKSYLKEGKKNFAGISFFFLVASGTNWSHVTGQLEEAVHFPPPSSELIYSLNIFPSRLRKYWMKEVYIWESETLTTLQCILFSDANKPLIAYTVKHDFLNSKPSLKGRYNQTPIKRRCLFTAFCVGIWRVTVKGNTT